MAVPILVMTAMRANRRGGGYSSSPPDGPESDVWIVVGICIGLCVIAATLLIGILVFDWGHGPKYTIKAGYPAKVVNNWATGYGSNIKYYGPERWKPILVTHRIDCADCEAKQHTVHPSLYKTHQVGDDIWFEGDHFNSVVVEKRFSHGDYYASGYGLQLEVVQCIDGGCVRGKVRVTLQTWMDFSNGDTITFSGKKGSSV